MIDVGCGAVDEALGVECFFVVLNGGGKCFLGLREVCVVGED